MRKKEQHTLGRCVCLLVTCSYTDYLSSGDSISGPYKKRLLLPWATKAVQRDDRPKDFL
jgi:hypothetical protein